MKRLVLCGDDFALSPGASEAILELLAAGRLSATGAMSDSPLWPSLAPSLAAFSGRVDLGLHVNLTLAFPGRPARSLVRWILASRSGRVSRGECCDAFLDRVDRFAERAGRLPDFIDGHEHVHALPVLRDALADAIRKRWPPGEGPYLRGPDLIGGPGGAAARLKRLALRGLAARFSRRMRERGLVTARWFGGVYAFRPDDDFPALMAGWLAAAPDGGLIMCHPGRPPADPADPIGAARIREYRYLAGERFAADLARAGVSLSRFAEAGGTRRAGSPPAPR